MKKREDTIRRYFAAWVENDPSCLREIFAPDIVYSECYGPEYRGIGQIAKWFADWNMKGRVLEWTVKSFLHDGNRTAAQWSFSCEYEGWACFDGVSLIEFADDGKIISIKEFQSKTEHEFPYGEETEIN